MADISSVTPPPVSTPDHKHFFIIGSLFTLLMLLFVAGILYFNQTGSRQSFIVLYDSAGNFTGYFKDSAHVFYEDDYNTTSPLPAANPNSFQVLLGTYGLLLSPSQYLEAGYVPIGKDDQFVYMGSSTINGADANTFHMVDESIFYYADKNNVYFYQHRRGLPVEIFVINNADPSTFEVGSTTDSLNAQDKNHKYLDGQVVGTTSEQMFSWIPLSEIGKYGATSTISGTTVTIGNEKTTDGGQTFISTAKFESVDTASFEIAVSDSGYFTNFARDKKHAYYGWRYITGDYVIGNNGIINGADPSTFIVLAQVEQAGGNDEFYAKDKNRVYFNGFVIPKADAPTFVVLERTPSRDAQDKNYQYLDGQIVATTTTQN